MTEDAAAGRRVSALGWASLVLAAVALVLLFAPLTDDDGLLLGLKIAALPLSVVAVVLALTARRTIVAHRLERGWQASLGGMILGGFALAAVIVGVVIPTLAMITGG